MRVLIVCVLLMVIVGAIASPMGTRRKRRYLSNTSLEQLEEALRELVEERSIEQRSKSGSGSGGTGSKSGGSGSKSGGSGSKSGGSGSKSGGSGSKSGGSKCGSKSKSCYDPCDPNPCQNGGQCVADDDDYTCNCPEGYEGQNCQTRKTTTSRPTTTTTKATTTTTKATTTTTKPTTTTTKATTTTTKPTTTTTKPTTTTTKATTTTKPTTTTTKPTTTTTKATTTTTKPTTTTTKATTTTTKATTTTTKPTTTTTKPTTTTTKATTTTTKPTTTTTKATTTTTKPTTTTTKATTTRAPACDSRPCHNDGTCVEGGDGDYTCKCTPEFNGKNCENRITTPRPTTTTTTTKKPTTTTAEYVCSRNPCLNGGSCVPDECGGHKCQCPDGYSGFYCEDEEGGGGSGGHNCDDKNPCDPENTKAHGFYFAHTTPPKFVQCDEWGQCFVMDCPAGLEWDDSAKTCNYP